MKRITIIAAAFALAAPALAAEPDGTGENYWTTCEEAYRFCESHGYHRDCVIWRMYGAPLRRRTTEVCPIPERFHPRPEDGRMPWAELPEGTLLEDGTPVRPSGQKQAEDMDGPIDPATLIPEEDWLERWQWLKAHSSDPRER